MFSCSSILVVKNQEMEASKFLLSGISLTVCALIFQLVGLASPNWITTNVEGVKIQVGLWKLCAKVGKKIWCHKDKDIRGKRQIFVILNYYFFIFICSDISCFSNSLLSYIFFFLHFAIMTVQYFFFTEQIG